MPYKDSEKRRAYSRAYSRSHPHSAEYMRAWHQAHPGKQREYDSKWRAKMSPLKRMQFDLHHNGIKRLKLLKQKLEES